VPEFAFHVVGYEDFFSYEDDDEDDDVGAAWSSWVVVSPFYIFGTCCQGGEVVY
jgi:hypothetical protein